MKGRGGKKRKSCEGEGCGTEAKLMSDGNRRYEERCYK
jgi:hypothetical protein